MFSNLIDNLLFLYSNLRIQDSIDLLLVWVVVYRALILIRRTGTVQMLSGLGILAIAYVVSIWLELFTFNWLLEEFFANLFVIVVILFSTEIRRALAQIGSNPFFSNASPVEETQIVEEIGKALINMAQRGIGALIVMEREIQLDYNIEEGIEMDSKVSSEILRSIFEPTSPLHDGAVIIRSGKIYLAACFLPLSKNPVLDRNLGTRHRAAIGLTEETDAVVFVVSEEARTVSIVQHGHLSHDVDMSAIRRTLYDVYDIKFSGSGVKA